MSTSTTDARALFSPDGKKWQSTGGAGPVTKVVVGSPPRSGEEGKPVTLGGEVLDDLRRHLAAGTVTHLYLWQVTGLEWLTELPKGLKVLDLRGCREVVALPKLPEGLETLDLGWCEGLKNVSGAGRSLESVFLNDCAAMSDLRLRNFFDGIASGVLREIDVSRTALSTLDEMPMGALRRLVLEGCQSLTQIAALGRCPGLEHLNLSKCPAVTSLPDMKPIPRFLTLSGAENLVEFCGQSVGPYDRGAEGQNVSDLFRSRQKFGQTIAPMPHAKLLLMGDGRVGKTTLAKRFQYEEKRDEALRPDKNEEFTHKVRFWCWNTDLELPASEVAVLEQLERETPGTFPKLATGRIEGAVRLWDFGGQEIYHATHRIFAGEGSVFLVVWRQEAPDPGSPPEGVPAEEWREQNRHRSLDYWLDYIYSMRPDAKVALVCTKCSNPDKMPSKPNWKARAPKHAHRELDVFFVDSLADDCGTHKDYQSLVKWVRKESGAEASRIGIRQPQFFCKVSELVNEWLRSNSAARESNRRGEHLILDWNSWEEAVRGVHARTQGASQHTLTSNDISALTGYLHSSGHVFVCREEAQKAVLVDQEWATGLIYRLLLHGNVFREIVRRNGGLFVREELQEDQLWRGLDDDLQRNRLLAMMAECRVVTQIADAKRQWKDVFLASDKWVLPTYEAVERRVDLKMQELKARPGSRVEERFDFEGVTMSEMDFRSLQAQLAGTFGTQAVYFRNGFQAHDEADGRWCFRVRWMAPPGEDDFYGTVDAVLVAPESELDRFVDQIEELFFASGSPLVGMRREATRKPAERRDLEHEYFRGVRMEEPDVAVSSSGKDKAEALAMVAALNAAGFKTRHYLQKECREGGGEGVFEFMRLLGRPPCIVLLLSDGFLHADSRNNWYCAWELADAVCRLADGRRGADQTIVVYKKGGSCDSKTLNLVMVELFGKMCDDFAAEYGGVPARDRRNFKYLDDFSGHFATALDGDKCKRLFEQRGTLGSYLSCPSDPSEAGAFSELIAKVATALNRRV